MYGMFDYMSCRKFRVRSDKLVLSDVHLPPPPQTLYQAHTGPVMLLYLRPEQAEAIDYNLSGYQEFGPVII